MVINTPKYLTDQKYKSYSKVSFVQLPFLLRINTSIHIIQKVFQWKLRNRYEGAF